MRDVFDRFSLPRERLARGEPAEMFSSLLLLLFSLSFSSCFYHRRSFRRGLHRVFLYVSRAGKFVERNWKKKSTFSLHFWSLMFAMKLPHLLLLPLLLGCALLSLSPSISLSALVSYSSSSSLSLSLVNVVPFFFYISKNSSVCNCNFGWNILFRGARVCAYIHAFLSLSSLQIHRARIHRA